MEHPRRVLGRYDIKPKKSLGQNFITNDSILLSIAMSAELQRSDEILEVGPGIGDLTMLLADRSNRLVAIEIDERLVGVLENRLRNFGNIEVVHGDILEVDPNTFFDRPFKIVANLPYYITGAFLRHIYSIALKPSLMILTIQEEVARRISAEPGDMSLLAVSVQYYAVVELVRSISRGNFWPSPNVDSAVVRFKLKDRFAFDREQERKLFNLVKVGFSQKRKQLQNNLRELGLPNEDLALALHDAGIDGTRRAQSLSVDDWINLQKQLD